jgi:hypothetical protein
MYFADAKHAAIAVEHTVLRQKQNLCERGHAEASD